LPNNKFHENAPSGKPDFPGGPREREREREGERERGTVDEIDKKT